MNEKPVIVFHDVSKTFKIKHAHSFKEAFIARFKRKELSTHFNAVDHLSFEVKPGESVALMGRNGSGKSTTLKLLSGVMAPETGWVRTRGRTAGLLEVGAGFHPDLTGRENVYLNAAILGMSKEETEARFEQILAFSEIGEFIDTEVKRYSSGMYARLGFAVAVHTELDTLLVDEVLAVGDAQFRKKCDAKMLELQEQGKTMFIVSHSFGQVRQLCSRGIVLERGKMVFDGEINEAIAHLNPEINADRSKAKPPLAVKGGIEPIWNPAKKRYGKPIFNETQIEENGGGWYQQFEHGYITFSKLLNKGCGILEGPLLDAYLRQGGPRGEWGFITEDADGPTGGSVQSLGFQNGTVANMPDAGFTLSAPTA